jgi:signal transduction histidine kinase
VTGVIPSAYLSMRRGLITFGLIWQGAWLLSDPSLWPSGRDPLIENVFLGFTWVSWIFLVGLLLRSRAPKRISRLLEVAIALNLLLILSSASIMAFYSVGPDNNEWFLAASLFNLVVGTAAIMIRDPWQWIVVGGIVFIEICIFIGLGLFNRDDLGLNSMILYPAYAISMGIGAASVQRMLLRRANEIDDMQDGSLQQTVSLKTTLEIDSYVESLRRSIHESVLNTLTAISRGSLKESVESRRLICDRARESARILSSVSHPEVLIPPQHVEGVVTSFQDLLDECEQRGIEVQLSGNLDAPAPGQIITELIASAREGIINALRHSNMTKLVIRVDPGRHFCLVISDNGIGFNSNEASLGYGLSSLLKSSDNLEILIESHPSGGSTIRFREIQNRKSRKAINVSRENPTLPLVLPILSVWFLFSLLSICLTWTQFISPLYNVFALALYGVIVIFTIRQSRTGPVRTLLIIAGSLSAFVIYEMNESAQSVAGTSWTDWSSEAIVVLFLSISAAGTWWAWIVVGASWLLIQQNFPLEFIAPGFLLIMAGALLGMQLRRTDLIRMAAIQESTNDAVASAFSEKLTASRVEKALGIVPESTLLLLSQISEGSLDPWAKSVQSECAIAESHLRRMIFHTPTRIDPIFILSQNLSQEAFTQGILLDFSLDENFSQEREIRDIGGYLERVIQNLPRNSFARFSTGRENGCGVLRFVAQTSSAPCRHVLKGFIETAPWGSSVMLEGENESCEFLWEGTLN